MNRKTKKAPRGKATQTGVRGVKTLRPNTPKVRGPGRPPRLDIDA